MDGSFRFADVLGESLPMVGVNVSRLGFHFSSFLFFQPQAVRSDEISTARRRRAKPSHSQRKNSFKTRKSAESSRRRTNPISTYKSFENCKFRQSWNARRSGSDGWFEVAGFMSIDLFLIGRNRAQGAKDVEKIRGGTAAIVRRTNPIFWRKRRRVQDLRRTNPTLSSLFFRLTDPENF